MFYSVHIQEQDEVIKSQNKHGAVKSFKYALLTLLTMTHCENDGMCLVKHYSRILTEGLLKWYDDETRRYCWQSNVQKTVTTHPTN